MDERALVSMTVVCCLPTLCPCCVRSVRKSGFLAAARLFRLGHAVCPTSYSTHPSHEPDQRDLELQDIPASDAALARLCKALEPTLFDKLAAHARLEIATGPEPPVPERQQQPGARWPRID